ncbi:MAG TPA: YggT family protein [Jatrophihabitantaceae bacterium]|jgi:YggT family protein|nr:YggT family protein [Jatrophihabitantaceae bacterium]
MAMRTFWGFVGYGLYLCVLVILARFVIDMTRQFARSWRPAGVAAIGIEVVYLVTDPPIRAIRKLVPPLRIGSVSLDLSIMILLFGILGLQWVALTLA